MDPRSSSTAAERETAATLLELEPKWLQPFAAEDPFNGGIPVEGWLSLRPDHRYGALAILRVGGRAAPQAIPATPKLHYPFDREGTFHFPKARRIAIYEKLDGTNVLAYRYADADGRALHSFKLRLFPFLRNGRFGNFLDLWRELLARHPALEGLAAHNGCHLSFEMYGARNAHLIEYAVDLEVACLFGVDATWGVIAPDRLDTEGVPTPRRLLELAPGEDPVARFQALREELERGNRPAEEERIAGSEGAVWFLEAPDGRVTLWKCKPESVEAIHWTGGINKAAVIATCWNLLETADALTYEALVPLLLEEYREEEVVAFRPHIDRCIAKIRDEVEFAERVMAAYAATGLSIDTDKPGVMRALSRGFERTQMKRVYYALRTRLGL